MIEKKLYVISILLLDELSLKSYALLKMLKFY